jgi:hypothetical protein
MVRHRGGLFERAAVLQIGGGLGCAEVVVAELGGNTGCRRPPVDHRKEPNGFQVDLLIGFAMHNKPSVDFCGYCSGHGLFRRSVALIPCCLYRSLLPDPQATAS